MNLYRIESLSVGVGKVGPGGINCPCCTKGPKNEIKPLIRRSVRRVSKHRLQKEKYEVDIAA